MEISEKSEKSDLSSAYKRHISFRITHPADAGQSVEPAERQDGKKSDDMYVKESLHHRRLRVAFWFYRGIRIGHVQQSTTLLFRSTTANIARGHQTGHRVQERVVLRRQHVAHVLLLKARDRKRHSLHQPAVRKMKIH